MTPSDRNFATATGSGINSAHTYGAGTYNDLTVTDDRGSATATGRTALAPNVTPTAALSVYHP